MDVELHYPMNVEVRSDVSFFSSLILSFSSMPSGHGQYTYASISYPRKFRLIIHRSRGLKQAWAIYFTDISFLRKKRDKKQAISLGASWKNFQGTGWIIQRKFDLRHPREMVRIKWLVRKLMPGNWIVCKPGITLSGMHIPLPSLLQYEF